MGRKYGPDKEINVIIGKLEQQGWRLVKGSGGHWKAYAPDGVGLVTFQSTSGYPRALANLKSTLRRYGANV